MKKILIILLYMFILFPLSAFGAEVSMTEEYMEQSGFYRYYLNDEYYIESTVRLGSVVDNIVRLTYNDYVNVVLYKDGEVLPYESGDYIYGDGEYTVVVKDDEDIGRINFILDTISSEDIDLEDEFYNNIEFTQSYSRDSGMYRQDMEGYYSLYTSIPNCAITDKGVRVYFNEDERAYITATKDGEEFNLSSGKLYSEPGYYSINVVYDVDTSLGEEYLDGIDESDLYDFSEEDMEEADVYTPTQSNVYGYVASVASFSFQITKGAENLVNYINPPIGYKISSVILDGKQLEVENSSLYKTLSDGQYRIVFQSINSDMPDYSFNYRRDRSAPRLTLKGIDAGGIARDQLEIIKQDESSQVEITGNGMSLSFEDNIIDVDGLYKINVTDEAGNFNSYMVRVEVPVRIGIAVILPLILVVIGAILIYIKYTGSHIQIR